MFQIFGMVDGMTGLIMGTVEFEPLVIFAGDNSDLCLTLAAMIQRALVSSVLHKFLHEHVNFTLDFCGLQYGIFAGDLPLDFSVFEVRMVSALLSRRLVEFLLGIGIRFGFHSFGIRLAMAGPVIAIGFRRRREAGRRGGSIVLPSPHLIDKTLAIDCDRK